MLAALLLKTPEKLYADYGLSPLAFPPTPVLQILKCRWQRVSTRMGVVACQDRGVAGHQQMCRRQAGSPAKRMCKHGSIQQARWVTRHAKELAAPLAADGRARAAASACGPPNLIDAWRVGALGGGALEGESAGVVAGGGVRAARDCGHRG